MADPEDAETVASVVLEMLNDPELGDPGGLRAIAMFALAVYADDTGAIRFATSSAYNPLPPACSQQTARALELLWHAVHEHTVRQVDEFGAAAGLRRADYRNKGDA